MDIIVKIISIFLLGFLVMSIMSVELVAQVADDPIGYASKVPWWMWLYFIGIPVGSYYVAVNGE